MYKTTLGVIVGNRGFFPAHLAEKGRKTILEVLKREGIEAVSVKEGDTKYGAIENLEEAKKCGELFRKNREKIDGILVSLPNFGDERGVAETIKISELSVPILIHAFPDELDKMGIENRRDSFCGKLSVCNNLRQYGIPFSVTKSHTTDPTSKEFCEDLKWFSGVCRVVKNLRRVRIGAVGARTTPFKTVRYSEKILEHNGISVETIDLSEIVMRVEKLQDTDSPVKSKLKEITSYCVTDSVPKESLLRMAKLGVVLDKWIKDNDLDACAIQCWSAMQDALRIFPCGIMSMLSESLIPAACEVDVTGALAMYALQLASGKPSGLFDWNNNYGNEPNKMVFFHCSNYPKSIVKEMQMGYNDICATIMPKENTYGSCYGRVKAGPMTFARITTDDLSGEIIACIGEGRFTDDPLNTFGGVGVAEIEELQELLQFLCKAGFEHHVAITHSRVADILFEAMEEYLDWDVYYHRGRSFLPK